MLLQVYKQRVKHLLYEHQNEITQLKTGKKADRRIGFCDGDAHDKRPLDSESALKIAQMTHREAEGDLKTDRRGLKLDLKEMELSHEDYLKSLKQDQDKKITLLRQEFERTAKELQLQYERKRKVRCVDMGYVQAWGLTFAKDNSG